MKKIKYLSLLGLAGIATLGVVLTSCGSSDSGTDVYALSKDNEIVKLGTCDLIFKENSQVPYVSLSDGTSLLSNLRSTNLDDKKYKVDLKKEGNNYVLTNETGAKCTIDKEKQSLIFDDYDMFSSVVGDNQKPLSIATIKKDYKPISIVSNEYTAGKSLEISLKDYSRLDIYEKDDKCYLPLSVYNSVLLNTGENMNLAYNGKSLFFLAGNSLSDDTLGFPIETKLGEKFREGVAKTEITQEYLEYYYQSLCFDFDNEYGLTDKFENFDSFLTKYYKNDILSVNPKQIDNYTAIALTWLGDGHTALSEFSNFYEFGDNEVDKTKLNPIKQNLDEMENQFRKDKKAANIKEGIEYQNDTVFVTFDSFKNIDTDSLYGTSIKVDDFDFPGLDDIPGLDFNISDLLGNDTAKLFNNLYKQLTSGEHKDVTNIVIDLTTNEGGAADALIYALSTLIGNVSIDMTNPKTGAHNKQVFKADINADGNIDSKDISLADLGYKIYFLDSQYSFSSANAMPYIAKLNNSSVKTIGAKTAGGPCAVRSLVTPIGSVISSSSLNVISKFENGKYVNIDDGINADHTLTEEEMLQRGKIVDKIKNLK